MIPGTHLHKEPQKLGVTFVLVFIVFCRERSRQSEWAHPQGNSLCFLIKWEFRHHAVFNMPCILHFSPHLLPGKPETPSNYIRSNSGLLKFLEMYEKVHCLLSDMFVDLYSSLYAFSALYPFK